MGGGDIKFFIKDGKVWVEYNTGADTVSKKLGSYDEIIGKLTELGYTPDDPQEEPEINTQIAKIYSDRYTAGYNAGGPPSTLTYSFTLSAPDGDHGSDSSITIPIIKGYRYLSFTVRKSYYGKLQVHLDKTSGAGNIIDQNLGSYTTTKTNLNVENRSYIYIRHQAYSSDSSYSSFSPFTFSK